MTAQPVRVVRAISRESGPTDEELRAAEYYGSRIATKATELAA
ncbi:hypothetical protein [Saccharopolyspora soli]|nr:hypothetical protein [Saccharopolyspora soli]